MKLRKSPGYPYVFINPDNGELIPPLIKALDLETSYLVQNPDRVIAARNKKLREKGITPEPWDGRIRLLRISKQGNYYFPVGLLESVLKTLRWYGIEPELDIRFTESEQTIPMKWGGPKLRDYQVDAFIRAKSSERCITQLPTGAGKSLLSLKLISTLEKPTLIVVHTKLLLKQWVDNVRINTGIEPTVFNDKTKEFGPVTVAMVQSLDAWLKKKGNKLPIFDILLIDECFPYDTLIQTDRGLIRIGEIVEQKMRVNVLTHTGEWKRITHHFTKRVEEPLITIHHAVGSITCTQNHKILTGRGWISAKDITCRDVVCFYEPENVHVQNMWEKILQNGSTWWTHKHSTRSTKRTSENVVESCKTENRQHDHRRTIRNVACGDGKAIQTLARISSYINAGTNHTWKPSGRHVNSVSKQTELVSENNCCSVFKTTRVCKVEISTTTNTCKNTTNGDQKRGIWRLCCKIQHTVSSVFNTDIRHRYEGWSEKCITTVAGCNTLTPGACSMVYGRRVFTHNTETEISNGVAGVEDQGGVQPYTELVNRPVGNTRNYNTCWKRIQAWNIFRRRRLHTVNTTTHNNRLYEVQNPGSLVYDLEVEDNHSYIANGVVVHNCHHVPSNSIYSVAMKCDARYRFGMTATVKREDGTDMLMFAGIGPIVTKVKPEDLVKLGSLALPKFEFISVPPTMLYGNKYADIYKSGIVLNVERNALIMTRAKQLAAEGRLVYIHVEQIMHGKLLSDMSGFPFVYSQTKNREEIIDKFRSGEIRVLISTLLGEGVDIPNISAIIMAGGRKTEIGTIQKVGRALRPSDRQDAIIVDFLDKGKYIAQHAVDRYTAYVKFFGDYVLKSVKEK